MVPRSRLSWRHRLGFSLVEIVLALGVFAGAIVAVAGLLPTLVGAGRENADLAAAERAGQAVLAHLSKVGFATVVPALLIDADAAGSIDESDGRLLFADRAGDRVGSAAQVASWVSSGPVERCFFETMLIRNALLSPPAGDAGRGVVVFSLLMSWPACQADGLPVPRVVRSRCLLTATLRR